VTGNLKINTPVSGIIPHSVRQKTKLNHARNSAALSVALSVYLGISKPLFKPSNPGLKCRKLYQICRRGNQEATYYPLSGTGWGIGLGGFL